MKKIKTNKLLHVFTLLLLSGLLCCCIDERESYEPTDADKLKTVTFSVKVPGGSTPKTYALAEGDENEVSSIAILLFDDSGNYTYQPIYSNAINTDSSDSKIKTFSVKVPEGTYDMMILANANVSLTAALSSINTGDSKASVVSKLLLSNSGKWNADPGSPGYIPIPMWGEIIGLAVSNSMPVNNPVTLIRMISKIDVSLDTAAKGKFNLQSVRLYNYSDQGQIAPTATNWSSATNVATAPSVPFTAQKPTNPVSSPLLFDGTAITKDPTDLTRGVSCLNEIYAFEAPMGSSSALPSNTCLVVGGVYEGDTQATYYRIDLANTTGTGASATVTYLALFRNHRYKINITNVKSSGLPTPEDAFNSRPVNIVANVVKWNEALITDIKFDGQYLLGISQGEFTFTREARTDTSDDNTLYVTTDYPGGWSVQKIIDDGGANVNSATNPTNGWLSLSPTTGASGATVPTRLLLAENNTSQTRNAYIHLTAGRLSYIVKVQQGIKAKLALSITNTSGSPISVLEFGSTIQEVTDGTLPAAQSFNLNWSPASSTLFFTSTTINTLFAFAPGLDIPASGTLTSGSKSYTIQPTAIDPAQLSADPFCERSSIYLYTVSDGAATINKTFTLRQYVYNVVPVVSPYYLMDGTQKSFGVRCNSPFTVTLKSNPNNVIALRTTSGVSNTNVNGTPVYFDIIDDLTIPTLYQRDVVVTIKSPMGLFPDTDVTLNCISGIIQPASNSYMVALGGIGILIPVSRANESMLGIQLSASEAFTTELVWTDNPNGIAANSNIKLISAAGEGNAAYILVMSGSVVGNAVVAIKNLPGVILWSWHIWVTDYVPTPIGASRFMDRNLGAFSNTSTTDLNNISAQGLLYQWGRKDPFPASTTLNGTIEPILYTAIGTTSITKVSVPATPSTPYNVRNAFENPTYFYYNPSIPHDWYSSNGVQNDTLWSPFFKSVYDPCPPGWRIPEDIAWANGGWIPSDYGYTNANYGGFYPAAGSRDGRTAHFNFANDGYYWSVVPNDAKSRLLYFDLSGVYASAVDYRAHGFSVRCVQE